MCTTDGDPCTGADGVPVVVLHPDAGVPVHRRQRAQPAADVPRPAQRHHAARLLARTHPHHRRRARAQVTCLFMFILPYLCYGIRSFM